MGSGGAIELPEFQRRMMRKLQKGRPTLAELLERICPKDGVPVTSAGTCPVCRVLVSEAKPEPAPDLPEPSEDAVKAARTRQFHDRLERQRREREQEAVRRAKKTVPAEEQRQGRDWSRVLNEHGYPRHW